MTEGRGQKPETRADSGARHASDYSFALISVRLISVLVGFVGAVSFMRSQNRAYNYYFRLLLGNWFNFSLMPSVLLLAACLVVFAITIWLRKGVQAYPLRRVDYSFLLLFCASGFAICTRIVWTAFAPRWIAQAPLYGYIIVLPFVAYLLALLAFGELVARLRDKYLIQTLYWIGFFRIYSAWQPVGFIALMLLLAQVIVMVMFYNMLLILVVSILVIGAFTYFAVHMINLSAEYDIAAADKIQSERFKSELITNVSHDIKTPLTSIINYVDLLGGEGLKGQAAEYVDVLARKSARLKVLIDDLMEASKAGTGNLRVDLQVINLTEIVGQVAGEFEDAFADKGLTLVIRQPGAEPSHSNEYIEAGAVNGSGNGNGNGKILDHPNPVRILADSRHLYRALENLFANAGKYGLGGTRVFAEVIPLPHEDKTLFALQNTSEAPIEMSGMALTEQFIRGDRARNTEGSGLGLYIAKSLVELMGGQLTIHVIGDLFRVEVVLC